MEIVTVVYSKVFKMSTISCITLNIGIFTVGMSTYAIKSKQCAPEFIAPRAPCLHVYLRVQRVEPGQSSHGWQGHWWGQPVSWGVLCLCSMWCGRAGWGTRVF